MLYDKASLKFNCTFSREIFVHESLYTCVYEQPIKNLFRLK